ncbi:MAG: hypothetical protein U0794_10765 [Isosphaeraceae bacterium]
MMWLGSSRGTIALALVLTGGITPASALAQTRERSVTVTGPAAVRSNVTFKVTCGPAESTGR